MPREPTMKTLALPLLALLPSFLPVSVSCAALPEETQVVQAESMTLDGDVLYLSAGALVRDEFDHLLGLDEALDLRREPFNFQQNPGRSEYEMRRLRTLDVYEGIKLFCGTQDPYFQTFPAGRGKVIVIGFFPAISYIAMSERAAGAEHSTLDFDAAHRAWMQKVLAAGNIQLRLRTDNYRVEANWIQSPDADLIAICNWTGHEQTIVVELDNAPAYREIASVTGKIVSRGDTDRTLRVQLSVAAGDIIQLKK